MKAIKSPAAKMGIKEGSRGILINAPGDIHTTLHLPALDLASRLTGHFDYIHFFTKTLADLDRRFPVLMKHLQATGMLWVSWPKAGQLDTDLTMKSLIRTGYYHGLVESKAISLDATWSALKFTHPRKGKIYRNSYGVFKT
ncbi:hypothetical protein KK083_30715 [Fulvivirgaceae bacterium PWU4]|uniref:DUF3052 domain-containing protein n=1 Tax=Chryseosolibacter histidini TaxID=2782349 RepID=A0AAP2GSL5_9BACT|nr:hypothetical protein [Chryseosolibacter histidini]MBT1701305.1 hypothetical protein [Chryseosolibacter histidini]